MLSGSTTATAASFALPACDDPADAPAAYYGQACSIKAEDACFFNPASGEITCSFDNFSACSSGVETHTLQFNHNAPERIQTYGSCEDGSGGTFSFCCVLDQDEHGAVSQIQLTGTDKSDTMKLRKGTSYLYSSGYKNMLVVSVHGGAGGDTIEGSDATSYYKEQLYGDGGIDTIKGYLGDDVIRGGNHRDYLYGGGGKDSIYGDNGHDEIWGGNEGDEIWGGNGEDTISGGLGPDEIWGGPKNDTIHGNGGDDVLWGETGASDQLYGDAGHDLLYGGPGVDYLYGGADDDWLYGGTDGDFLYGEDGNDYLCETQYKEGSGTGPAINWFIGGAGIDYVQFISDNAAGQQNGPSSFDPFNVYRVKDDDGVGGSTPRDWSGVTSSTVEAIGAGYPACNYMFSSDGL